MINKSNIGEVTIEEKGFKLTIKQKEEPAQHVYAAPVQQPMSMQQQPQQALPAAGSSAGTSSATEKPKASEPASDNYITIKSPMIGTFYRSQSPGKPAFIEVGDDITPDKGVCLI